MISQYVGIPYKAGGRDFTGCDCFGLVRLVLMEEFGKNLPEIYQEESSREELAKRVELEKPEIVSTEIKVPEPGAIVLLRIAGVPCHVGVMIDKENFIHCVKGAETCIENITSAKWRNRIEGFYRV